MLIGGDDVSDDVITLGRAFTCFSMFSLHSRSFPLCADWRKSDSSVDGESQGNWRQNSNFQRRCKLQAFLPFPAPPLERPKELARRLDLIHQFNP